MLPDTRLLRTFAALSLGLVLGACTTTDPKLPNAASLPVPESSPRLASTETPVTDSKVEVASAAKTSGRKAPEFPNNGTGLDSLISKYSVAYEVPESLVRRIVHRESRGNPAARNGPYWGLMQMLPATARGMGHTGSAKDLLDAETNLKYGVKYLAGAYKVADNNPDQAVRLYARGYYFQAKKKGLLEETGLRPSADVPTQIAAAPATPIQPTQAPATATTPVATAQAAVMTAMAPVEAKPALPTQLAYANEPAVVFPAVIPLPMQRPETASTMPAEASPANVGTLPTTRAAAPL